MLRRKERGRYVYSPFGSITAAAKFAPSLKFATHAYPDTHTLRHPLTPDIAVYPNADQSQGGPKDRFIKNGPLLNSNSQTHLTCFVTHRIPCSPRRATFSSTVIPNIPAELVRGQLNPPLNTSRNICLTTGDYVQLDSHPATHAGCQCRIYICWILTCGKHPRFIHWDRDGATSYQALWLYQGVAFSVRLILVLKTSESSPERMRHFCLMCDSCRYSNHLM
jgi:hypothetical protein